MRTMPRRMVFVGPGDREEVRNLWPWRCLDVVNLVDHDHTRQHPGEPARILSYARVGEDRYQFTGIIGTGEVNV